MTTYIIRIQGELAEAIDRARSIDAEYQPAWDSEDKDAYWLDGMPYCPACVGRARPPHRTTRGPSRCACCGATIY